MQGCKKTEYRLCWIWTINGFLSREVNGLLSPGQSSNRNYFQFRRHRYFLKYPSLGMNKPNRSLPTLQWLPIELMGRGKPWWMVQAQAVPLCSPGMVIAHRALPWQSWWEGRACRGLCLLPSSWRAPGKGELLVLPRNRQCSLDSEGILRMKAKSYP